MKCSEVLLLAMSEQTSVKEQISGISVMKLVHERKVSCARKRRWHGGDDAEDELAARKKVRPTNQPIRETSEKFLRKQQNCDRMRRWREEVKEAMPSPRISAQTSEELLRRQRNCERIKWWRQEVKEAMPTPQTLAQVLRQVKRDYIGEEPQSNGPNRVPPSNLPSNRMNSSVDNDSNQPPENHEQRDNNVALRVFPIRMQRESGNPHRVLREFGVCRIYFW
ncbi:MAG: hypothetical protein ACREOZ_02820 [Gloeomargaritales cyanobacterium]